MDKTIPREAYTTGREQRESREGFGCHGLTRGSRDSSTIHLSVGGAISHGMKRTKLIAIVAIVAIAFIALRSRGSSDDDEEEIDRID